MRSKSPWAYLRVRGGTGEFSEMPRIVAGLSPRARRNLAVMSSCLKGAGPISACAEEPRRGASVRGFGEAYLRVRGGTDQLRIFALLMQGLSPRARRNRFGLQVFNAAGGPISACAEEPRRPFPFPM
ncbi:conserved hypothetical protein [Burkholderia sp. 8Y]|nr:conserved hypothetical protein [Burkholderia sp. 8Y]